MAQDSKPSAVGKPADRGKAQRAELKTREGGSVVEQPKSDIKGGDNAKTGEA